MELITPEHLPFVIQSRDAPGTFGFGNDLGTAVNQPDIVQNEATGDSPRIKLWY